MFLALALAGLGSVIASPMLWFGSLMALWAGASLLPRDPQRDITSVGICVAALALWITATNFLVNPAYTAAAPFHAALLLGGYLFGRRVVSQRGFVYAIGVAFAVALAVWALQQQLSHGEERARGLLVTPATLAAVINLFLAPGLTLVVLGERRPSLIVLLAILCAALAATLSRGGWLALGAALAVAMLFTCRAGLRPDRRGIAVALTMVLIGCVVTWLLALTLEKSSGEMVRSAVSFRARLELFGLAMSAIDGPALLHGAGYHFFYYLLDANRDVVPTFGVDRMTYFVHDDYLQFLLELGAPGLAALLFLVAHPIADSWRRAQRLDAGEKRTQLAFVAAITSIGVHAMGDFPFYIPLCGLVFGATLGMMDALRLQSGEPGAARAESASPVRRAMIAAAWTLGLAILVMPVAAEATAKLAAGRWQQGDGARAAFWFEAARRLDSRDWRYHWYAGQFWEAQAQGQSDREAARLAEVAYGAAMHANRLDPRPLHARLLLHTLLRRLLAEPAPPATLHQWSERLVRLAPTNPILRAERDRIAQTFPLERQ